MDRSGDVWSVCERGRYIEIRVKGKRIAVNVHSERRALQRWSDATSGGEAERWVVEVALKGSSGSRFTGKCTRESVRRFNRGE